LLATPGLQGSIFPPDLSLTVAFRAGLKQASVYPPQSPAAWARADMMWFFSRLVRMLGIRDYHHFESLYILVQSTEGECAGSKSIDKPGLINDRMQRNENKLLLEKLREEDWPVDYIQVREGLFRWPCYCKD
jgi:hypothetical protein